MLPPPRVFGIVAHYEPVVAVVRRGPSRWTHHGRWDISTNPSYQRGSWLHGKLYPSDAMSPSDGRCHSYLALGNRPPEWALGTACIGVSRLPWLLALLAWGLGSMYSRGARFAPVDTWEMPAPDYGDAASVRSRVRPRHELR